MPIGHFWRGLPTHVNAAFEREDGKFAFFKGNSVFLYTDKTFTPPLLKSRHHPTAYIVR